MIRTGWVDLVDAEPDEWREYRNAFDPTRILSEFEIEPSAARDVAETLLMRAHNESALRTSFRRPSMTQDRTRPQFVYAGTGVHLHDASDTV